MTAPKSQLFCPWCGHILPEDTPCKKECPAMQGNVDNRSLWAIRLNIILDYGVCSGAAIILYLLGTSYLGSWGGLAGFIPCVVLAFLVR